VYWAGFLLIFVGVTSILWAVASDLIGFGGQAGLGGKQKTLIGMGVLSLILGISLTTPAGRNFLEQWARPEKIEQRSTLNETKRSSILRVLMLAVWFGLITGFIEVSYQAFQKYVLGNIIDKTEHFLWMAPIVYLFIFLLFGLVIIFVGFLWPKILTIQIAAFVFLCLGMLSLYYVSPKIHIVAGVLLAIGLSFQISRFLGSRAALFYRLVTITLPWMAIGVLSLAAFMIGYLA
jgi:hypothetical protein